MEHNINSRYQQFLEWKPHSPVNDKNDPMTLKFKEDVFFFPRKRCGEEGRQWNGDAKLACLMVESEHGRKDPCMFLNIMLENKSHNCASSLFSK